MPTSRLASIVATLTLAAAATLTWAGAEPSTRYMVVWAGDWNAADLTPAEAQRRAEDPEIAALLARDGAAAPDFLAVIDVDPASATYGRVVNTVPVPGLANEPHHMQYSWKPGERVYAGGLFSDRTFVFDVDRIPAVTLAGVVEPLDTPCGSVPDAYWVLSDGSALGTYMGGPNAAGDPRCNGGNNNGFAGTPGEIVRIAPDGTVLGEFGAAGGAADARDRCVSNPPLPGGTSCANPHGIQAREDLGIVITADYAEPRNVPIDPARVPDPNVFRDTIRVWNLEDLTVRSVSVLPEGTMTRIPPQMVDPRGIMGIMETTVTNLPEHRGAFASSMCGGQIYYTADVTDPAPVWRQVFDATAAAQLLAPGEDQVGGCVGAGWLQTSPDDTLLFQAVIGRHPLTLNATDPGVPKMVYALDIRELVAVTPAQWRAEGCTVDTDAEIFAGGDEHDCPRVSGAVELADASTGGPHWGAIDTFSLSDAPGRVSGVTRLAASNYFVARAGLDGNHRVCMIEVSAAGALTLDQGFRDENTSEPCVSFDRAVWPHGANGAAKPHSMLFVNAVP